MWSGTIGYHHCCFMNLGLNSAQRKIHIVVSFPLELPLVWVYPFISLFLKIFLDVPIWVPTRFLEVSCPRYSLVETMGWVWLSYTYIYIRKGKEIYIYIRKGKEYLVERFWYSLPFLIGRYDFAWIPICIRHGSFCLKLVVYSFVGYIYIYILHIY